MARSSHPIQTHRRPFTPPHSQLHEHVTCFTFAPRLAVSWLDAGRLQQSMVLSTREDEESEPDNVAIFPLATPLLAGPSAIMSVIVVTAGFAGNGFAGLMTGYAALLAVMALTGVILTVTVVADRWLDERVTMVFSRITAIILAGLSVQYVIDGLTTIGIVAP